MARRVKSSRRKMSRKMSKSKSKPKKTMKRRGLSSRAKKISEILSSTPELASPKKAKKTKKAPKKATKKKTKKGMTYKSFVKANFKKKQKEMPGSPAPDIIKAVAAEWKKMNTDGKSAVKSAPAKKAKKKSKKKKTSEYRPPFKP